MRRFVFSSTEEKEKSLKTGKQSFREQKQVTKSKTDYTSSNDSVPLLCCLQSPLTILGTTVKGATAVVPMERGAKSAIAGKKSDSSGQTTATGGLLQSSPCAQPSKSMRLQEKKKKSATQKGLKTGSLVSLQHDVCCCGPASLVQSPLPQHSLIHQYSNTSTIPFCSIGLQCHNSFHTKAVAVQKKQAEKNTNLAQSSRFLIKPELCPKQLQELK